MWLVCREKEQKWSKGLKFRAGVRGPKYRTMKIVTNRKIRMEAKGRSNWSEIPHSPHQVR